MQKNEQKKRKLNRKKTIDNFKLPFFDFQLPGGCEHFLLVPGNNVCLVRSPMKQWMLNERMQHWNKNIGHISASISWIIQCFILLERAWSRLSKTFYYFAVVVISNSSQHKKRFCYTAPSDRDSCNAYDETCLQHIQVWIRAVYSPIVGTHFAGWNFTCPKEPVWK